MNEELGEEEWVPAIDWSRILSVADDPDLKEILRSPTDEAVHILQKGREIQKLSVIRTLSDLLDTEGEIAIEKILPLIQRVLEEEAPNLDIHCEAAVTYKNIYRNEKLSSRFHGLTEKILLYILQNIEQQRNNLSTAAWLETLVEILEYVPTQVLSQTIVPVAIAQANPAERAQRRVIATKLIEKLSTLLPSYEICKELLTCVKMLSQDSNVNVRNSIAQRLGTIANSLRDTSECSTLLLPCLLELCGDDDIGVREAILDTVAVCLPCFSRESKKNAIFPLIKRSTEQALLLQDVTLTVVAKNLGKWLFNLKDEVDSCEYKWFLDTYIRLANLAHNFPSAISSSKSTADSNTIQTVARRMCAYNFPCFVLLYEEHFKERLLPLLEGFCADPNEDIRSAIASGFHEIVKLKPNEARLISSFIELIRCSASEVVGHLTGNLDQILPSLYKCAMNSSNGRQVNKIQLDRILIGCNRLIRGTSLWRAHQSYLLNIAVIRKFLPANEIFISFVPMLKQEVLTGRAIPCRVAAASTLLLVMRENRDKIARQSVSDFFIHSVSKHQSCHRRRILIDITPFIISNFSRKFFHENFLQPLLSLAADKISNIRLQLCKILSKIKENLILPDDEIILQQIEKIVRDMLSNEQNAFTRHLIQTYAYELSRVETRIEKNRADEAKEKEEEELWKENPEDKENIVLRKSASTFSSNGEGFITRIINESQRNTGEKADIGRWRTRTQVPKTAIARPQPKVTVTQRTPSPMPRAEKSRMSLSRQKSNFMAIANGSAISTKNNSTTSESSSIFGRNVVKNVENAASLMNGGLTAAHINGTEVENIKTNWSTRKEEINDAAQSIVKYRPPTGRDSIIIGQTSHKTIPLSTKKFGARESYRPQKTNVSDPPSSSLLKKSSSLLNARSLGRFGQPYGLIKVRSFSNIEKQPSHLSMKIHTIY